jgi:hypothetical protein
MFRGFSNAFGGLQVDSKARRLLRDVQLLEPAFVARFACACDALRQLLKIVDRCEAFDALLCVTLGDGEWLAAWPAAS